MSFVSHILPPWLGYFFIAVLAVTPQTHALRVASWPVVTLLALRTAVSVDMSLGEPDQKFRNSLFVVSLHSSTTLPRQWNHDSQFSMIHIATRTFDWTLAKEPLVRHLRPAKDSKSIIMDALDLALTSRGHGWDWSRGVYIPRETRPTTRRGFTFHVILSAAFHALFCGVLHSAIRSFSPTGPGSLSGASIFDETLPFYVRYPRGSIISAIVTLEIYAIVQTCYDASTITGVLVLGQDPAQWPPAFDAPWRATSLSEFWGRRWHQFYRRMFIIQGSYPLSFVLGRAGFILGAFLASGVLHHIAMVSLDDQLESWRISVGFGMMAAGVLIERAFKQYTGRRVSGVVGWVWTMAWLLLWGNVIIDAQAKAGLFGYFDFTVSVVPGQAVVERSVANFDAWLHAM
jgi:hypothetical protein